MDRIHDLIKWRKKYKQAVKLSVYELKQTAINFQHAWGLQHIKGATIYALLRDDWNSVIPLLCKLFPERNEE